MAKQKPKLAAQILGIIQSLTSSLQNVPTLGSQFKPDVFMESARASLGDVEYTAAYQAGSQMSLDEAVAFTLKEIKR
jgi:hypothetical protein